MEFNPRDKWVVEKNPDYWNKELPYVDRIERISIQEAKDRGTAVLTGQVDFADAVSVDTYREALKRPNEVEAARSRSPGRSPSPSTRQKPPFNDARVRRAVHLAISRQDSGQGVRAPEPTSRRHALDSTRASPLASNIGGDLEAAGLPGRQDRADMAEAKKLMAAAGFENGFKEPLDLPPARPDRPRHRDLRAGVPGHAEAHLGLESMIRPVETSVYWDQVRVGDYHMTSGAPAGAINDPQTTGASGSRRTVPRTTPSGRTRSSTRSWPGSTRS